MPVLLDLVASVPGVGHHIPGGTGHLGNNRALRSLRFVAPFGSGRTGPRFVAFAAATALTALFLVACASGPTEPAATAPAAAPTAPPVASPATAPTTAPTSPPAPTIPESADGVLISAATGGRVTLGDPDAPTLEIDIPPGALSSDTVISATIASPDTLSPDAESVESVGPAFQLLPAGLRFDEPVAVTLRVAAADAGGSDVEAGIRPLVGLLRSEDGAWDALRDNITEIDPEAGTLILTGETSHFSELVVVQGPLKVVMTPASVGPLPAGSTWPVNLTATNLSNEESIELDLGRCTAGGSVQLSDGTCLDEDIAENGLGPGLEEKLPTYRFECQAGPGSWGIRVEWSETEFVVRRTIAMNQAVPIDLESAAGTIVLVGQADCTAPPPPPTPTNTPTPEPVAFVDFPALEPEFVDCIDGVRLPFADSLRGITAGDVNLRVGQRPPSRIELTVDLKSAVEHADQTGGGLPSIQVLIRDNDAPPLPDSPGWHFDNIYGHAVQIFFGDNVTGYLQDVRTHELVELPLVRGTFEDGLLDLFLPPDIFPDNSRVAVGLITPDNGLCAEYVFDGFELPAAPEPQSIEMPRTSFIPYSLSTPGDSAPFGVVIADFLCDSQPELYQVDQLGQWFDLDLSNGQPAGDSFFRTPPGSIPFAGDWTGDGLTRPARSSTTAPG